MKAELKYSSKKTWAFIIRNVMLYAVWLLGFILVFFLAYKKMTISEMLSFISDRLFLVVVVPGLFFPPILILVEQLYHSYKKKLNVDDGNYKYYIGSDCVLEFCHNDIEKLIIFKETAGVYFFPAKDVSFAVLRIKGNYEIVVPSFMGNLDKIAPLKAQKQRMALPSIFYYNTFMTNNPY